MWGIAPIFTVGTNHKLPSGDDGQMQEGSGGGEYKIGEWVPTIVFLSLMYLKMYDNSEALLKC